MCACVCVSARACGELRCVPAGPVLDQHTTHYLSAANADKSGERLVRDTDTLSVWGCFTVNVKSNSPLLRSAPLVPESPGRVSPVSAFSPSHLFACVLLQRTVEACFFSLPRCLPDIKPTSDGQEPGTLCRPASFTNQQKRTRNA